MHSDLFFALSRVSGVAFSDQLLGKPTKMVCPMAKKGGSHQGESPTEYPFEPLYRPWSWVLSSASNILLFAVLFATIYAMYRRKKSKGKRQVGYRTIQSKKAETIASEGKIKALVTGGSGALGREIVHGLIADGHYQIYSLDLFIPDEGDRNDDIFSYIQADITDKDSLRLALKDIEVVFHTAGIIPNFVGYTDQDFHDVIATGTENVVAVCKELQVKRLIYTSSISVLLSSDLTQVVENFNESTPYPKQNRDAYGAAKVIAEKCVLGANGNGIVTCTLRPSRIMDHKAIALVSGKYFGNGSILLQLVSVDTVARVHILAERKLQSEGEKSVIAGKVYFVTPDDTYTQKEFAEFVAKERDNEEAGSLPIWVLKFLVHLDGYLYSLAGKVLVSYALRTDALPFFIKTHTFSGALGRREIGWEDKRTWKDVLREKIKEFKESKKDQ